MIRCAECGAARAALDEPLVAEVLDDAEPLEAEVVAARPARRDSQRPRTDDALTAFASGCYWARVGLSLEAFGFVLGLVMFALATVAANHLRRAPCPVGRSVRVPVSVESAVLVSEPAVRRPRRRQSRRARRLATEVARAHSRDV